VVAVDAFIDERRESVRGTMPDYSRPRTVSINARSGDSARTWKHLWPGDASANCCARRGRIAARARHTDRLWRCCDGTRFRRGALPV